jgi:preprotein translocase subunit YajC
MWILAQSETSEAPTTITSEPITEEQAVTTVASDPNAGTAPAGKRQGMDYTQFIFLGLLLIFVWMFLFRGPRKKQQEHKKMVQSLQKNDRVRTIGGIFGTVVDVKDDEIVLKVDESNNTKIRISPSAVGTKVSEEKG